MTFSFTEDNNGASIICENPRFPYNIAMVARLASAYGISQVLFTGDRVQLDANRKMRLPQKEWANVEIIKDNNPLGRFGKEVTPVAIEFRVGLSQPLTEFIHPQNAVYVFGPEDGAVSHRFLEKCHLFAYIPTRHCLNLSTAVSAVLWDRYVKLDQLFRTTAPLLEEDPEKLGLIGDNSWPKI